MSESPILRSSSSGEDLAALRSVQYATQDRRRDLRRWSKRHAVKVFIYISGILGIVATVYGLFTHFSNREEVEKVSSPCFGNELACNITAPFIFDSVYALAKQWPSTYAPNGHSIVPVILPPGTPLYHSKQSVGLAKIPTFVSFDPEMGLGIYASTGHTYAHTLVTTKPLRLLYFDGQAAALTTMGTLDSQTAYLRKRVTPSPGDGFIYDEDQRAAELCSQVSQLGMDGVMRMNAGFEALVCDRDKAGLTSYAVTNVTVPGKGASHDDDPNLPKDPNRVPPNGYGSIFAPQSGWEWVRSSTWHYGGYGGSPYNQRETRVYLDLCGLVTFYDPRLTSLQGTHHGGLREGEEFEMGIGLRRGHRLLDIAEEDAENVRNWVKRAVRAFKKHSIISSTYFEGSPKCSGTNWQTVTEVITLQHKSRLQEISKVLEQKSLSAQARVEKVHALSHAVLHPFLEYPAQGQLSAPQAKREAISKCSFLYTKHLKPASATEFEALIKDSIEIVLQKICTFEWILFEWSESQTTGLLRSASQSLRRDLTSELNHYSDETANVLSWIGWNMWEGCEEPCAWNELCYIPMWPVVYSPHKHQGGPWGGSKYTKEEEVEFWKPKCVSFDEYQKWGGRGRDPEHQLPDPPWFNEPGQERGGT